MSAVKEKTPKRAKAPARAGAKKARKPLKEATPETCFWVNNGPVCKSVKELREAIASMSDEQFHYHTKRGANDFAKWLDEAMCHPACAVAVKRARTRSGAAKALAVCKD